MLRRCRRSRPTSARACGQGPLLQLPGRILHLCAVHEFEYASNPPLHLVHARPVRVHVFRFAGFDAVDAPIRTGYASGTDIAIRIPSNGARTRPSTATRVGRRVVRQFEIVLQWRWIEIVFSGMLITAAAATLRWWPTRLLVQLGCRICGCGVGTVDGSPERDFVVRWILWGLRV